MYTLIVVDYNGLDTTIEYVRAAYRALGQAGAGHTVIVENGDPEGTLEKMSAQFGGYQQVMAEGIGKELFLFEKDDQQICYCNTRENLGYAKGNNLGAMIASRIWADPYYIISNNDLVFGDAFDISNITALFEKDSKLGAVGPGIVTPAGLSQSPRRWQSPLRRLFVTYWVLTLGTVLPQGLHKRLWDKLCDDVCHGAETGRCDWLMGCFFFVRSDAFERAGMFDPYTFLYGEEMIFSRRLESAGFYSCYCQEVGVTHNHGQTTKTAISQIKVKELDFLSNCYYYEIYEHTAPFVIQLAKWNFALYKGLFLGWQRLKALRRR